MASVLKFNLYNVTNIQTKAKAKVWYYAGTRLHGGLDFIEVCEASYCRRLPEVLQGTALSSLYENNTDSMIDYFERGSVRVYADHPEYPAILAAMLRLRAKRQGV